MMDIGGLIQRCITIPTWIHITIKSLTVPLGIYHPGNTLPTRVAIMNNVRHPVVTVMDHIAINTHHVVYHG